MAFRIKMKRTSKVSRNSIIISLFLGALIVFGLWKFSQDTLALAMYGYETKVTVQSIDRIVRRDRKGYPDSYTEYYTVTLKNDGEVKEVALKHSGSSDATADFSVGEVLPAVVDDLDNPSEVRAPKTKEDLAKTASLFKIITGVFIALFVIQGIRMFRRFSQEQ